MTTAGSLRVDDVRGLADVVTLPAPSRGFMGDGHTAVHVMAGRTFEETDPFIMLADDRVNLAPGARAGGAHPHAGFEIATFAVEGQARDRDEGVLRAGDVLWMTAGSGVIHNEDVEPLGKLRILQLWATLPSASRWAAPRFEHVPRASVAIRREPGVEAHVYSGRSGAMQVPAHTYLPLTLVDIRLAPNATFDQDVPPSYNGFLYPLEGQLLVDGQRPSASRSARLVGWPRPARRPPSI